MSERASYEPGTPCWVDLGTADPAAAAAFYGALFGWDVAEMEPIGETGGYAMASLRGKNVAGLGAQQNAGLPYWTTYVSVDDVEKTAALAAQNGATVVAEAMDVLDAGRLAVLIDPVGAAISLWQPQNHIGAQMVNEPGALAWTELTVRDVDAAKAFYEAVFGWEARSHPSAPGAYYEFKLSGTFVAGMFPMNEEWPADMPSRWMPYFATEDTDATAAKAAELGAAVRVPPTDIAPGKFAVISDPQGALFAVIQLNPEIAHA